MRHVLLFSLCVLPQVLLPSAFSRAQEATVLDRVGNYSLQRIDADESLSELKFTEKSLLNWTNPVFGTTDGGLFLWTDSNGRPQVVMKTYRTKKGNWFEQVRSVSEFQVIASQPNQDPFWFPAEGASAMRELPGAPGLAPTPATRLAQMKAMHRRFAVSGDLPGAGGQQQLRAYPSVLYRYPPATDVNRTIDGGIFGFMQGTGPDVLLQLEIRRVDGTPKWFYRFASVGIFKAEAQLDGKVVWTETRRTAAGTEPSDLYDGRRLETQ